MTIYQLVKHVTEVEFPELGRLGPKMRHISAGRGQFYGVVVFLNNTDTRVYPKVSGLAACSENCKWYSSLPLGAVVSLFCESV
jgi:hypothetical protein